MSTKRLAIFGVAGLVVLAGLGFVVFNLLFTNNTAPSGALTAIPLVVNTAAASATAAPSTATNQPGATAASTTASPSAAAVSTTAPTADSGATTPVAAATASTASSSGLTVYQIVPEKSQVSFTISEELGGQPNTVVGTTNQVAGQLALNPQDLSQTQVGVIKVDARGLTTDNDRRNGALRNFILNTNQYEYITFTPKSVSGLKGAGQIDQSYTFQVTGDLTIRDVTHSVTFDFTAQSPAKGQIAGSAKASVNRSDYNLSIPNVPNVANVGEKVTLQIDLVASAVG